jgi:hypothetical protein
MTAPLPGQLYAGTLVDNDVENRQKQNDCVHAVASFHAWNSSQTDLPPKYFQEREN